MVPEPLDVLQGLSSYRARIHFIGELHTRGHDVPESLQEAAARKFL